MNAANPGAPTPLVTDEDRAAHRNRRQRGKKPTQEELGADFINTHGDDINHRIASAASKQIRRHGRVKYVEAIVLQKKTKRRNTIKRKGLKVVRNYLEQTLPSRGAETARVRIHHSWFTDPADGNRKYTIGVTFKPALK